MLRREARFCWKCNADQTVAGPPAEVNSKPQAESFGRPEVGKKRKAMSIESYMKAKSTERQSAGSFRSKKKNAAKEEKQVSINIGIKVMSSNGLKTVRGKRLPLLVPQQSTYAMLLEKSVQKWSAYDKKFDGSKQYVLLYDDERCAQFMPG
jgi:hypothetical protein